MDLAVPAIGPQTIQLDRLDRRVNRDGGATDLAKNREEPPPHASCENAMRVATSGARRRNLERASAHRFQASGGICPLIDTTTPLDTTTVLQDSVYGVSSEMDGCASFGTLATYRLSLYWSMNSTASS